MDRFFEHLGFDIETEWHVVGEYHGHKLFSTNGGLGDIRGGPNLQKLAKVENNMVKLIRSLT